MTYKNIKYNAYKHISKYSIIAGNDRMFILKMQDMDSGKEFFAEDNGRIIDHDLDGDLIDEQYIFLGHTFKQAVASRNQ